MSAEPENGDAGMEVEVEAESSSNPVLMTVTVESTTTPTTTAATTTAEEPALTTTTVTTTAVEGEGEITTTTEAATTVATTMVKVVGSPSPTLVTPPGGGTVVMTKTSASPAGKDNIIFVVNKVDPGGGGGEVKLLSKPVVVGSFPPGVSGTAEILKRATMAGNIVKVQKTAISSPQGSPILGKKSVVIASRAGGVNQLIACGTGGVQGSSTPVVLTQKVASGGVLSSPIVSTGRVSAASIASLGGAGGKILTTAGGSGGVSAQQQQQSQQRVQDVRVDNWGNYCLQRLQAMYDKGDYCDLTLRFHSSQEIKVHRVVVNLCTEYFSNLEKLYGLNEGTLILPKDVEFQTMQTIIRFFYTGKLEVRGNQFNDIYRTVKMMNITILIKLLEAHSRKPAAQLKRQAGGSGVVLKQSVELGKGEPGQVHIQVATGNHPQSASPVIAVPMAGSKALQVAAPGAKLPPGMKTKTVLARVQSQSAKGHASQKSTPKKLPIWKERKYTPVNQDPPKLEKWQIKAEEPARPTRFEWGDPDDLDPFLTPTLTNHALMDKQKEKHSTSTRKAEDIFDTVKSQQSQGTKRPKSPETNSSKEVSPNSEPPAKIQKLDDTSAAEPGTLFADSDAETEVASIPDNASESTVNETNVEEVTTPTLTLNENRIVEKKPVPILKPALKSPMKVTKVGADSKDGTPQKSVRFAPEVEKENKAKASTSAAVASPATTSTVVKKIVTPSTSDGGDLNHSKIISEVLRKFPDLVKDNKNIKLKIVQKSADGSSNQSKDSKSKISYIVLKSPGSSDTSSSTTVLKKSPAQSSVSKFWEPDRTPKKPSLAENTTGPWLCERCGDGENTALQFDTYYNFRRHLGDVHQERIDARICEYCGQKASKRNLLLYHLYTKHGVQPPKNCTFPHCDRCDYVALSESLLTKHKQNHDANKEFCCLICNASFKTAAALQGHMTADLHRNKDTKVYECPYCRKPFVRNINLKAHIRSLHRDVARMEEMEDPRLPSDETLLAKRLFSTTKKRGFPSILANARASTSTGGMVEFISSDDIHTVSYVTADGQPIEILDPSTLTSLPITMVSSVDDGMAGIATSVTSAINMEPQTTSAADYVTSVPQDSSQQAVYLMDGSQGVEIDMANMGLAMAPDGSMVFEGEDPSQNFIVQDMQGNQFRRITGIDETGKPVMFLQMITDGGQVGMAPTILDDSMPVDGTGNSQVFVSSAGMPIPVSTDGGEGQQVIFASAAADGTFVEMVPADGGHQVVMSEAVLSSQGEELNEQQHLQLVQHDQSSEGLHDVIEHDEMGQPVQELHIVLDQQDGNKEEEVQEEQVVEQDEGMEIVEVQPPETYAELQLVGQYGDTTIEATEEQEVVDEEGSEQQQEDISECETQQMEIDENSQQLQIDEGPAPPHALKLENMATQEIDTSQEEEDQADDNLQESIELVEGQTLTLIEDEVEEEEETQTVEVDEEGNVEEIAT